mgnify:CR=1 FL=1
MVVFDMDKLMPEFPRKPHIVEKRVEVNVECSVVIAGLARFAKGIRYTK